MDLVVRISIIGSAVIENGDRAAQDMDNVGLLAYLVDYRTDMVGIGGRDEAHCGAGLCRMSFLVSGYFDNTNIKSAVSGPCLKETISRGGPSLDGTCGPNFPNERTCSGSAIGKFGACCSNFGFCGNETAHCRS
jgi:hypothetical protein